ncbi:hypothetical protein WJR50_14680 [Catalinimonas sp. 4WD22]|uniref:hypothetical protein n=1 Tax=Catalinimonas locisalis TaxID=3133978 RepID=UPI003100B9F3
MQNIYKEIVNTIPVFFFLWDRDEKETTFISEQFYDYRSGSYFSSKDDRADLRQYIHPDFQEVYDNFFTELSEDNNFHNKVDLKAADNLPKIQWVQLSSYPIVNNGQRIKYISGHIRDITSEKAKYQVLEDQVKGLDTVLFLMAHELSAPTANIMGLSDMLKLKVDHEANQEYLHFYDTITDLAGEIQTITRGLIGLIEMQSSQDQINSSSHWLFTLLEKAVKGLMYNKTHSPEKIDFQSVLPEVRVYVQEDQFIRAMEELLLYMQKYNQQHYTVKIHTQENQNEQQVDIIVATEDIMLPMESIKRVLEHKGRLELKDVKGHRFRGALELIIAKEIIEKHKGCLVPFEDKKQKGFCISLPIDEDVQCNSQK